MLKNDNGRVIPKKNYIYLSLIIIFSLMVIYYGYLWHRSYKESLIQNSIVDDYLNVIQYNEIDSYVMENGDAVIYVSILGDEDINKFELKFVNMIRDYSLRDNMLYMDVTNLDSGVVKNKFGTEFDYPFIVVYTNGKVTDIYSVEQKGYSTKKIVKYLNRIGVISDD